MSSVKRRSWCTRRRTRSVGSMPFTWQSQNLHLQYQSDEMCSSSTSKDKDCLNCYQSDSDDICSAHHDTPFTLYNISNVAGNVASNIKSDSFNKDSPCARRKRKFKRIAMEIEMPNPSRLYSHNKKKRVMRHSLNRPNNRLWLNSGKRKRSLKEKISVSLDGDESSDLGRESKVLALSKLSLNDCPEEQYNTMEVAYSVEGVSSSSISSSGSEAGIFTNDEGREGDDEQSDWVGDVGLVSGGSFNENGETEKDSKMYTIYQKFLLGNFDQLSSEEKKNYKLFLNRGNCDVRASRRRGRSFKPNFNVILPPADKKNSKFPTSLENNNCNSKKNEMDVEGNITTRRHTFSGYKKRKRIPQQSQQVILDTTTQMIKEYAMSALVMNS